MTIARSQPLMNLPRSKCATFLRSRRVKWKSSVFCKGDAKLLILLKMLAVMEASSKAAGPSGGPSSHDKPPIQEFLSSGRTGRRNALPDILGQHAVVTSSDLPARLQALSTTDQNSTSPSNSNESQPGPSTSQS